MYTLQIKVVNGRNLPAADLNGYSDPYVKIFWGGNTVKTNIKKKTLNPYWDESFSISSRDPWEDLKLTCYDYDRLTRDDVLGGAMISTRGLVNNVEKPVTVQLTPRGEICIRLTALDFPADPSNQSSYGYPQSYGYSSQQYAPPSSNYGYIPAPMTGGYSQGGYNSQPMQQGGYATQPIPNSGYTQGYPSQGGYTPQPVMSGGYSQGGYNSQPMQQPMMTGGYPSQGGYAPQQMTGGYPQQGMMTGYPTSGYVSTPPMGGYGQQTGVLEYTQTTTVTGYPQSGGYSTGGYDMYAPMGSQVGTSTNTGLQPPQSGGYSSTGQSYGLRPY